MHPRAIRRDGDALLALIEQAAKAGAAGAVARPLDPEQRGMVKALRERVGRIAEELSLKPDVLVRRRWLEALVRDPDALPEPLTGWREELVARPLRDML